MEQAKTIRDKRGLESGVNPELNHNRFNILFLGMGNEVEGLTDSIILMSYDLSSNTINLFSFPRDLHAPEVDRFKKSKGDGNQEFNAINTAHTNGGNKLVRQAIQDASGLSVDFTTIVPIKGMEHLIDGVFGEVEIEVPEALKDPYIGVDIKVGKQKLTAKQIMGYAMSRKSTSEPARVHRQQQIISALVSNAEKQWSQGLASKTGLLLNLQRSFTSMIANQELQTDFDIQSTILSLLFEMIKYLPQSVTQGQLKLDKPEIKRLVFDRSNGLDYEPRADRIRPHLVTVKGGNFQSPDLVKGFWGPFRGLVEKSLKSPTPPIGGLHSQM